MLAVFVALVAYVAATKPDIQTPRGTPQPAGAPA
jgi:hypothetical protein